MHTKIRILLIGDTPPVIDAVRQALGETKGTAFDLECCATPVEGLARLASGGINTIMLNAACGAAADLAENAARDIRRSFPEVPILILTDARREAQAQKLLEEGIGDYLVAERLTGELLLRSVRYVIERNIMVMEMDQFVRELMASEERFRNVIASNADAMVVVGRDGIVQFVNAAAVALFNRQPEHFIGRQFDVPVRVGATQELTVPREGHEPAVAEMRVVETEWEGHPAWLASLRDVTERKKAEEEKEKLRTQLIQAEKLRSIGMLASGVAHELNNPLTVILGFTQVLLARISDNEFARERLKDIESASLRCKKIVTQLLTFARQESCEFRAVSVNQAIENSLELVGYQLKANEVNIVLDLAADLPLISGSMHQLEQVFINLLTNARDAMPEGGELKIATRLCDDAKGAVGEKIVEASFSDTGCGIAPEMLDRIFDPFFTTKAVGQGTGLGLSMCMGIIERHNGRIAASSTLGKGTVFRVSLPLMNGSVAQPA